VRDWLDRLAHAPDPALILTLVLAGAALWVGVSGLRRARRIEDVPTARVRSAAQGYVELIGSAQTLDGEPIVAPLSQTACCWYRYRVERRSSRKWELVQSGTSDGIFLLRDATGDCIVDPEGAEITSRHKRSWSGTSDGWGGYPAHARLPSLGRGADLVVDIGGKMLDLLGSGIGPYRFSETVILPGDPLYAIGEFRTLGAAGQGTSLRELTGAILRDWKRRPDTLIARFDDNRDGRVDPHEWERARAVAAREAAVQQAEDTARGHLHTLGRPADGRLFLLSNLEEFDLLKRYRWRKRLGLAAFVPLALAGALMIAART
jgi:hypothetical protein